jgi:hypothetical protein
MHLFDPYGFGATVPEQPPEEEWDAAHAEEVELARAAPAVEQLEYGATEETSALDPALRLQDAMGPLLRRGHALDPAGGDAADEDAADVDGGDAEPYAPLVDTGDQGL